MVREAPVSSSRLAPIRLLKFTETITFEPLTLTGIALAPFGGAFEVDSAGLAGRMTGFSFGKERKWPSIFFAVLFSPALIQPMLPIPVFTINHFKPPAPVISAIGDKDCPSLTRSMTRDDSSGVVKTSTTVCSADVCRLEAAHPCGHARGIASNMKVKTSERVIG